MGTYITSRCLIYNGNRSVESTRTGNSAGSIAWIFIEMIGKTEQQTQEGRMPDPKALLEQLGERIFGDKDFSALGHLMRDDYIQHNPLVGQGRDGFKDFFEAWFEASPDFKFEVKQIVSEGDTVWVFGTYSGTHMREWLGIPATGRTYKFNAVDIFRIQEGKLAEHWDVIDVFSLFKQLGTIN